MASGEYLADQTFAHATMPGDMLEDLEKRGMTVGRMSNPQPARSQGSGGELLDSSVARREHRRHRLRAPGDRCARGAEVNQRGMSLAIDTGLTFPSTTSTLRYGNGPLR